jgi:hypothetical protein
MELNRESELKSLLDKEHNWPEHFLFKFIYKSDPAIEKQLRDLFVSEKETEIEIKESKKAKFNSMSVSFLAQNSDEILSIYHKARHIEGVISL